MRIHTLKTYVGYTIECAAPTYVCTHRYEPLVVVCEHALTRAYDSN